MIEKLDKRVTCLDITLIHEFDSKYVASIFRKVILAYVGKVGSYQRFVPCFAYNLHV